MKVCHPTVVGYVPSKWIFVILSCKCFNLQPYRVKEKGRGHAKRKGKFSFSNTVKKLRKNCLKNYDAPNWGYFHVKTLRFNLEPHPQAEMERREMFFLKAPWKKRSGHFPLKSDEASNRRYSDSIVEKRNNIANEVMRLQGEASHPVPLHPLTCVGAGGSGKEQQSGPVVKIMWVPLLSFALAIASRTSIAGPRENFEFNLPLQCMLRKPW